ADPVFAPVKAPQPMRGTETVLLVEDEPSLLNIASQTLREHGYSVISAPNGEVALASAGKHGGKIHLLVTDVVMPGMNGATLADSLKQTHPEVRVIFASGYTEDAIVHQGVL